MATKHVRDCACGTRDADPRCDDLSKSPTPPAPDTLRPETERVLARQAAALAGEKAPAPDAVVEAAIFLESLAASTQTGYAYASAAECREHAVALRALAASRAPGGR